MAKKKKRAEKPKREFTRRQLSMWQRQQRRQRTILYSGIFIIVAIVALLLVGWYSNEYRPLHQTVIKVNDTEFKMKYYVDTLKLSGQGQPVEYIQSLANYVVREIEQSELIRQGALKLGISVSDDEVRDQLKDSGLPINDATLDVVRNQMLIAKLREQYFAPQIPKSAEQTHVLAMLLESESQAAEVRSQLVNNEDFSALAEELSLDNFTQTNKGDLGWHPQDIINALLGTTAVGDYAFGSEAGVLSQPRYDEEITKGVGYWLIEVLEREEGTEDAQIQAILLGSEEEARDVRARLEAGEDFATLAKELSQHEASQKKDGNLGVVVKGELSPAFDEFAFNPETEVGTVSEPVRDDTVVTKGGSWLIKVVEKDDARELEANDRNSLTAKAYNEWAALLWADPGNEVDDSLLDAERKAWAIERVKKGLE